MSGPLLEVHPDAAAAAAAAAGRVAEAIRAATSRRGRAVVALSGGSTPTPMLTRLAHEDVEWSRCFVAQVDERVAPPGSPDRNLTTLRRALAEPAGLPADHLLAMPVDDPDLGAAAARYAAVLAELAGDPPVLDLVHLGLGADGHTASLAPGAPVLDVVDRNVAEIGRAHV